ncbi:MAG: hypothetical protein O7G87_23145 [bacterium]|nr:hypothetical protein [bacterium]
MNTTAVVTEQEETSYVSVLAQEVLDLYAECDWIDAMPNNEDRIQAMEALLNRVEHFEADMPIEVKTAALHEATVQAG